LWGWAAKAAVDESIYGTDFCAIGVFFCDFIRKEDEKWEKK